MRITINQKKALHPFNLLVFILSLFVIISLVITSFMHLTPENLRLLRDIDYFICAIFFLDFLIQLFSAKKKMDYLRWGWIDLLSSIPVFDIFLAARVFRVIQLLRVLRAFRSIEHLTTYYFANRVRGTFTSVGIIAVLMVIFCAIGILNVEMHAPGSNIKTAEDALWWAWVTITTVGYGDRFPVTTEGRIIAVALITVGVGLFGTFTAFVASWFVEKREEEEETERKKAHKIKHAPEAEEEKTPQLSSDL
ncbi:MAG: ion transporter [Flavisolibacter sp.]|jgi:voltage-gated potassium channel|nr:ion transporter [Flavisolibacter sp.]